MDTQNSKKSDFSLLETILWTPEDDFFLLTYHFRRLINSANHFGIPVDLSLIKKRLQELPTTFGSNPHRIRLLVGQTGSVTIHETLMDHRTAHKLAQLSIAQSPVDSTNPFLYHKTTFRQVYNDAKATCPNCDDVLLWNERGEITETCIANIVAEIAGELLTPPVNCGLLPGTFRAWLLDRKKVIEKVITIEDLKRSSRLYVINALRKCREAVLLT